MRILMPSIVDPQVARSGAGTVTRNLVSLLEAAPLGATVECVAIPSTVGRAHRFRQVVAIARSMVSALPAKMAYTYSREFESRVLALAAMEHYDLVMINGSDLLWLEPLLPSRLPRLLVAFNIEYQIFESQVERVNATYPGARALLRRESARAVRYELDGLRRTGNVMFLSSVDAATAAATVSLRDSIVVPPMFGERVIRHHDRPRTGDRLELGFIGNLRWWPNQYGLSWFVREVLPDIGRPAHLHVFGEGRPRASVDAARVTLHGPIADLSQAWERCDLMICPMRSGGGVSIKLAESVFHGRPTLTTPLATRGMPLGSDDLLVVREPADWVSYLATVDLGSLRGRQMAEEISRPFTYGEHRHRVQSFVRGLVAPAPLRAGSA